METKINPSSLSLLPLFKDKKVLVLGDLMLDGYISGSCSRISPEAPVPVVDAQNKNYCLGGAANVALNLRALGCQTIFCSVTGNDKSKKQASELLKEANIQEIHLIEDESRDTLVKTRISSGNQCLLRLDEGSTHTLSADVEKQLIACLEMVYESCDAVLIADYDKGLITDGVIAALGRLQDKHKKFLAIDSKKLGAFKNLTPDLIKPNYTEFVHLVGIPFLAENRVSQIKALGEELFEKSQAKMAAVTLDQEGVVLFCRNQFRFHSAAPHVKYPKVSGAGDTFISSFLLAIISGGQKEHATTLALEASRIAISKDKTSFCTHLELSKALSSSDEAIKDISTLEELSLFYHNAGKRIVFTNGCFDILHRGHISYLQQARELGDVLIVGINNDSSIKRLKGSERPINSLLDRSEVLSALGCVDHVFSFGTSEDDTPISLIRIIKPHVFVKGGDYKNKKIAETPILKALGTEIKFLPFVKSLSTTNIIEKINNGTHFKNIKTG